jgi:hypothetical protein
MTAAVVRDRVEPLGVKRSMTPRLETRWSAMPCTMVRTRR